MALTGGNIVIENLNLAAQPDGAASAGILLRENIKGSLTLKGAVTFRNFKSGAITNDLGSAQNKTVTINNENAKVLFSGNGNPAARGGAISLLGNGTSLNITVGAQAGLTFENNQAKDGGAIMVADGARLSIQGGGKTLFSGNKALQGSGGAIFYGSTDNKPSQQIGADISGCAFTGNSAQHGGGVAINASLAGSGHDTKIENCSFNANKAVWGGGYYAQSSSNSSILNSTFTDNAAYFGGGAYADGNLVLSGSTFTGNRGVRYKTGYGGYGGGLFFWGECHNEAMASAHVNHSLAITNTTFTGNSAETYGGAANLQGGTISVSGSAFESNVSTGLQDGAKPNLYGGGGALALRLVSGLPGSGPSQAVIENSTFSKNTTEQGRGGAILGLGQPPVGTSQAGIPMNIQLVNSTFSENKAKLGGAVANSASAPVTVANGTFTDNTAESGGAIFYDLGSTKNPAEPDAYAGLKTDKDTGFSGNKAATLNNPPADASSFTNLQFKSTSAKNDILNNYDVNFAINTAATTTTTTTPSETNPSVGTTTTTTPAATNPSGGTTTTTTPAVTNPSAGTTTTTAPAVTTTAAGTTTTTTPAATTTAAGTTTTTTPAATTTTAGTTTAATPAATTTAVTRPHVSATAAPVIAATKAPKSTSPAPTVTSVKTTKTTGATSEKAKVTTKAAAKSAPSQTEQKKGDITSTGESGTAMILGVLMLLAAAAVILIRRVQKKAE